MEKYLKTKTIKSRTSMNQWLKWSALLFCLSGLITTTYAQEAILAAGGNATGEGGSVSFSVGQVIYTAISGQENSIIPGVQQPYEISVVSTSEDFPHTGIDVQAYPNPTSDQLILTFESELNLDFQSLAYVLLDMNSRILEKKNISSNLTIIQMGNLAPATYILKVYHAPQAMSFRHSSYFQTKTFKIIKK